jgi:catechol 2,3-dioxygenase-like lactoylglutathione lyase family enzyme
MVDAAKARAIGVNHVALEVGDIEEALAFYGRLFEFKLRGKSADAAFIDLGDQFLALQKGRRQPGASSPTCRTKRSASPKFLNLNVRSMRRVSSRSSQPGTCP